jgi:hypothetical protein
MLFNLELIVRKKKCFVLMVIDLWLGDEYLCGYWFGLWWGEDWVEGMVVEWLGLDFETMSFCWNLLEHLVWFMWYLIQFGFELIFPGSILLVRYLVSYKRMFDWF